MPIGAAFIFVGKLVICAAVAGAGALWILSAWFDRRLRTWEAAALGLGLVLLLFLGVPCLMRAGPVILALPIAAAVVVLAFRGLGIQAEGRLRRQLDEEDIGKYQRAVEQHPENPYAHSLLADAYRKAGELELAAGEYEAALQIDSSLKQERYWLQWLRTQLGNGNCTTASDDGPGPAAPADARTHPASDGPHKAAGGRSGSGRAVDADARDSDWDDDSRP
jgi:tetratricopeptide (TPR) repeat protein